MGCACKASQYVTHVKNKYGYEPSTKKNVKVSTKIKMTLQALGIWAILIILAPLTILWVLFRSVFFRKKTFSFVKKIKFRL